MPVRGQISRSTLRRLVGRRVLERPSMSPPRADQLGPLIRRRCVYFVRAAVGRTTFYASAKRLWRSIEQRVLQRRLSASLIQEHRQVSHRLAGAIGCGDEQAALAIARNARQESDTRAEKIVSHRYKFVWMCNPKVASRSIIRALLVADPEAILVKHTTAEGLFSAYPEARQFFSFAFVRDPYERARSFFHEKLAEGPLASNWNGDSRYYGLRKGMSFGGYCRWLDTPFGADVFAERHWLSQYRHLEADGNLPDYVGSYENLEENWRWVLARLGVPCTELPHLNRRKAGAIDLDADDENVEIIHRRYKRDYDLFRKVGSRGLCRERTALGNGPDDTPATMN